MTAGSFDGSAGYWESAWQRGDTAWDIGEPAPPLTRLLAAVPVKAHAIVLGCGGGHEARMLAASGWQRVVGVDFAPTALERARERTDPSLSHALEWRLQDALTLGERDGDHDRGLYDLVVEHTCFCAIDPSERQAWAKMVARLLREGGVLCALFYTHGRPGGPPFGATHADVTAALASAGLSVSHAEVPADSIERRKGDEWLVIARAE